MATVNPKPEEMTTEALKAMKDRVLAETNAALANLDRTVDRRVEKRGGTGVCRKLTRQAMECLTPSEEGEVEPVAATKEKP